MILIIGISTFVAISLAMLGVYWLLYKPQSAATERLRRMGSKDGGNGGRKRRNGRPSCAYLSDHRGTVL